MQPTAPTQDNAGNTFNALGQPNASSLGLQPALGFGNSTATTNTTTNASPLTGNVTPTTPTTTIPATSVGSTQPFTPPAPQPVSGSQNALGAAVSTPSIDQTETNRTDANNSLLDVQSALNPGQETLNLDQSTGVNAAQQTALGYTTQMQTASQHFDSLIQQVQDNSQGLTADGVKREIDSLNQQKNETLAPLAILQAAATSNVTQLTDLVTKKVTADTDAANSKINALKDYITNIDADPQEKAQMTAQANAQQAKLDSVKTASEDVLKTAAQNGAPASVLAAIGKATQDPNATATSIYQAAGSWLQTKANITPFSTVQGTAGEYTPIDTSKMTDPNAPNTSWGGLSYNGLMNDAQHFLSTGTMPSLGLGSGAGVQGARLAIQNYAGQIADQLGMTQPQIQAMYKANSTAADQIVQRMAKIDTISSAATTQFPRLADLADKVKADGINITESDLQLTSAQLQSKFGNSDASNYIELLQSIRGDYGGLQSAMGGSGKGGVFFAQTADSAIPAGLTGKQYLGIMQTIQQSATNVAQATQDEANSLVGTGTGNPTGAAGGNVPAAPVTTSTVISLNGKTYKYNGTGDTSDINNWTAQ